MRCDVSDGIHLAEHTDSWWASVNTVTKLGITKNVENIFWFAKLLLAYT